MNIKMLKPLVMMQLKDKIDFSWLKSTKKTISKIVFGILFFVVAVAFSYLLFYMAQLFKIFSLINFVPISVVTVMFTVMLILSIIACTYGLMKSLYFSKDNLVLLTFPVSANMVFLSKLIVFYLYEMKRTITFLLPLFIGYGLVNHFSVWYFLWILMAFIFISAIPVAVGALLSIPAMLISLFLKRQKVVQLVLFAGLLVLVFFGLLKAISVIPANLNLIGTWGTLYWQLQDFLQQFVVWFSPFHALVSMMIGTYQNFTQILITGQTFPVLGLLLAFLAVVFALSFLLTKPLFFMMSSKPFEFGHKQVKKPRANVVRNKFISSIHKEFIMNFRTTELILSNFSLFAAMPIAIFLLNKIYAAFNIGFVGLSMTISFNILIILLLMLSSNYAIASTYSKEGASGYLIKTKPASYHVSLLSKLVFNALTMTLSLLVTVIILKQVTTLGNGELILMFITMWFVYLGHLVWSAEMDIMNPQNAQYATTGTHVSNPNEGRSTLFAFFMAFLFFGISLFLFQEGIMPTWIKLACIALAFMIARMYLFYAKIKIYYKEAAS